MEDLKKVQEFFSKPLEEVSAEYLRKNNMHKPKNIKEGLGNEIMTLEAMLIKLNQTLTYEKREGEGKDLKQIAFLENWIEDTKAKLKEKLAQHKQGINEAKQEDPTDIIAMDVPLFLRMLEYAREDAEQDIDLHKVTERAIEAVKLRGLLSMEDYNDLIGKVQQVDEIRLIPKDQIAALAAKLAAQIFSKRQDNKPAIDILKKALEDAYRVLDPEAEIKEDDVEETTRLGEGVIYEELCPKGKAYITKRKAAGEKSSAYLSGRAVKVCKGQMKG